MRRRLYCSDGSVSGPTGLPWRTNARSQEWRPGDLRHTGSSAESCCLPALTRFTGACCTGPDRHTPERAMRSHATLLHRIPHRAGPSTLPLGRPGGLPERPNGHAWKACEVQASVGSNPTPSAGHDTPGPTGPGVSPFWPAVTALGRTDTKAGPKRFTDSSTVLL